MIAPSAHHPFKSSPLLLAFRSGEIMRVPAGNVLYRLGEPATHVYWLHRGAVKLLKADERLKPRLLHILGPNHPLGLPDLFVGSYLHTAITLDYSLVCRTTQERILQLCKRHPDFVVHLVQRLDRKLRHAEQRIALLATHPPEKRVQHMLYLLHQELGLDREGYLNLPISRKDLAELASVSTRTLYRILKKWENRGWVHIDRDRLRILKPDELFHGIQEIR